MFVKATPTLRNVRLMFRAVILKRTKTKHLFTFLKNKINIINGILGDFIIYLFTLLY